MYDEKENEGVRFLLVQATRLRSSLPQLDIASLRGWLKTFAAFVHTAVIWHVDLEHKAALNCARLLPEARLESSQGAFCHLLTEPKSDPWQDRGSRT